MYVVVYQTRPNGPLQSVKTVYDALDFADAAARNGTQSYGWTAWVMEFPDPRPTVDPANDGEGAKHYLRAIK